MMVESDAAQVAHPLVLFPQPHYRKGRFMKQPHMRPSTLGRRRFLKAALKLGVGLAGLSSISLRHDPDVAYAAASLIWGPYLQSSTPTSIIVAWATTTNPASEVRYRIGSGPETTVAASATHCVDPFNDNPTPPFDNFYIMSATLSGLTSGVT